MTLTAWTFGPTALAYAICTELVENQREKDCKSIVTEISATFFGSQYLFSYQPASD